MDGRAPVSKQVVEEKRGKARKKRSPEIQQRDLNNLDREKDFCSPSQQGKGREREREGRVHFCLGPRCTAAGSSPAGLGILWGRHGAQTEGRKVQERINTKSEFLAAPGDDDSFW